MRQPRRPPWGYKAEEERPPPPEPRELDDAPAYLEASVAYWREHVRTPKFRAVADSLTDEWQPAADIARAAGVSYGFARRVLDVLAIEGEIERYAQPRDRTTGPQWLPDWRYVYRAPTARA